MWTEFTDFEQNRIALNTDNIIAIIVPSPLTRGDGKSRIVANGVILELSQSEARRIQKEITGALILADIGAKES